MVHVTFLLAALTSTVSSAGTRIMTVLFTYLCQGLFYALLININFLNPDYSLLSITIIYILHAKICTKRLT